MKNIKIISALSIVSIATTLTLHSCKKETLPVPVKNEVAVTGVTSSNEFNNDCKSDGVKLIFSSSKRYEEIVFDFTAGAREKFRSSVTNMSHTTFAEDIKQNSITLNNSLITDDYFADLLNKDRVIQIGKHLYKVNMQEESVFVIEANLPNAYADVVAENTENKAVHVFSTHDNVLQLVNEDAPTGAKAVCGGIGGGEYKSNIITFTSPSNGQNMGVQSMVKMFVGGVYNRLTAQAGASPNNGVIDMNIYITGTEAWLKRRYCGSGTIQTQVPGSLKAGTLDQSWEFYNGVANLNGYYLFIYTIAKQYNSVGAVISTQTTSTCGRNINSPY